MTVDLTVICPYCSAELEQEVDLDYLDLYISINCPECSTPEASKWFFLKPYIAQAIYKLSTTPPPP